MFGKLFKKKEKPAEGPMLMFVLLPDTNPVDHEAVVAAIRKQYPSVRVQLEKGSEGEVGAFTFGDTRVMAMLMPVPIPTEEVSECRAISRFWQEEDGETTHQAHVVLAGLGGNTPMERARAVAMVATGMTLSRPTIGWYVGSASQVLNPELAAEMEEGPGSPLGLLVWVNVIATAEGPGRCSLSTLGMETFGHREFEIVDTSADPGEWFTRLLDLANYVLESGPVLKHGQTFGATADEKIGIEVGKSKLGKEGTVIRLLVP